MPLLPSIHVHEKVGSLGMGLLHVSEAAYPQSVCSVPYAWPRTAMVVAHSQAVSHTL